MRWITIFIILFFSACKSKDSLKVDSKENNYRDISVIIYDGEKRIKLTPNENGDFLFKKGLLSTTVSSKYLLVVQRNGFLPFYTLKTYDGEDIPLDIPPLNKFLSKKDKMAYISGSLTKKSIGGKINFHSGLRVFDKKTKVHVLELDESNISKRDFYIETDINGYFGAYVNPGKYRIEYGKREEFQLNSGENGIFLMSIATIID